MSPWVQGGRRWEWSTAGSRRHKLTIREPDGAPVPDGDGGFMQPLRASTPSQVWASVSPATARDLERLAAGTVISTGSLVIRMPYHAGVTTQSVITFNGRILSVKGVSNPDERNIDSVIVAVEVVT